MKTKTLLILSVVLWIGLFWSLSAMANSPMMVQAKQLYGVKQWDQALYSLQKELKLLRGKPKVQKVPVYVWIGLCLYRKGNKGLAWRAFEQAFFIDRNALLPPGQGSQVEGFFRRAQKRVLSRFGGASSSKTPTTNGTQKRGVVATGTVSPWPWVVLAIGAAGLAGGTILMIDASANQGQLDKFLTNGVGLRYDRADLETSSEPWRNSAGLQQVFGIVALSVGGLAVAGAVTLFVLQGRGKSKAKTAGHIQPSNITPMANSNLLLEVK